MTLTSRQRRIGDHIDELIGLLKTAKQVVPVLAEQARLGRNELQGHLPTSPRGCNVDDETDPLYGCPPPAYDDPTGEAVVASNTRKPDRSLEHLAAWWRLIGAATGATRTMLSDTPAVTFAVAMGRSPTDGRSQGEVDQARYVRAISDSRCMISEDHTDEETFGPGQLRRGLCNKHRMAFSRWLLGFSDREYLSEADLLIRWRAEHWPREAAEPEPALRGKRPKWMKEAA